MGMLPQRRFLPDPGPLADANALLRLPAERGAWIWHPGKGPREMAFLRFRLEFTLAAATDLTLHVTADQRFQLSCDGLDLTYGPDRCDLEHWTVHTLAVDLAAGAHVLEALVWYIPEPVGELAGGRIAPPMAQVTFRGGFLLVAEGGGTPLDTGTAPWSVEDLTAAVELARPRIVEYHDIGPEYTYRLGDWRGAAVPAEVVMPAVPVNPHGVRRPGWCLYPAAMPEQRRETWRGGQVRALRGSWSEEPWREEETRGEGIAGWQALLAKGGALTLPAGTELTVLWDLGDYVCGYPQMALGAGAADALVEWSWAESLYEEPAVGRIGLKSAKGRRQEFLGKVFLGLADRWVPGPETVGRAPALWWRCGRYIRLRVRTGAQPLALGDVSILTTGFPLDAAAAWRSSDPAWDALMPLFQRAVQVAGHETWVDTPYYEQMCYVGDNVLVALTNYAWFRQAGLSRRSLQLYGWSRRAAGFVAERYPCGWRQESATFSLLWPCMLRDYAYWRADAEFVRSQMAGWRSVQAEFEGLADPRTGLLGKVPGWAFIDWVPGWRNGCGPGVLEGDSAIVNLQWVRTLQALAELEEAGGDPLLASRNRALAERVFAAVQERYWSAERGLFLDTANSSATSEYAQSLALLTGLLAPAHAESCLDALRPESVPDMARATIYASFYVLEALYQHGRDLDLQARLDWWRGLPDQGFTATPESPEPTRSDSHAWGAHPAFHTLASLAGIRPAAPGFRRVRIAPCPGPALEWLEATLPHPEGEIRVNLRFADGAVTGQVTLPAGIDGEFVWKGKTTALVSGEQDVSGN
jgi:hypothetical protein